MFPVYKCENNNLEVDIDYFNGYFNKILDFGYFLYTFLVL
jgi:hypothetical protein